MKNSILNWIVKKSNNKLDKEDIIWGFATGLVWAIAMGLVWGIVVGIILGFTAGLVIWFSAGLGSLIGINIIYFFKDLPTNWVLLIIILLVLNFIGPEYYLSKPKKKENKFNFTVKRKLISLAVSVFLVIQVLGSISTYKELEPQIKTYFPEILKWIGYLGVNLISLLILLIVVLEIVGYFWIKLNKVKHR